MWRLSRSCHTHTANCRTSGFLFATITLCWIREYKEQKATSFGDGTVAMNKPFPTAQFLCPVREALGLSGKYTQGVFKMDDHALAQELDSFDFSLCHPVREQLLQELLPMHRRDNARRKKWQ